MVGFYTFLFLIVRIFSNPIANVFQKSLSNRLSSFVINFYSYLLLSVFCIPFIIKYVDFSSLTTGFYSLVILAGFLCAVGTVCAIKAVNIGELSILGPINAYKSLIGLLFAIFLLKEIPSFLSFLGIVLIILGSRFIFKTTNEGFSLRILKRKDIQYRFLSMLFTGIEAAILKKIILLSSVETCFVFWCLMGLFWCFVFLVLFNKKLNKSDFRFIPTIFCISLCLGLMQFSTNFVFLRMNVGYALALFQLSSIVTVFFGYKFFKEQNFYIKLFGSLLMFIGSVFIILFK